jgi:hypothetical protein
MNLKLWMKYSESKYSAFKLSGLIISGCVVAELTPVV